MPKIISSVLHVAEMTIYCLISLVLIATRETMNERRIVAEPFLLVGIIASINRKEREPEED